MKINFRFSKEQENKAKVWSNFKSIVATTCEKHGACAVELSSDLSRTKAQNNYIHVIIREMSKHFGFDETNLREYLYKRFDCQYELFNPFTGEIIETRFKTLSQMTKQENSDFIDFVVRLAVEQGMEITTMKEMGWNDNR